MAKVMFLLLEDCSNCKALKNKLGYFNNSFKFYDFYSYICNANSDLCDQAEALTGAEMYPMAIILDINNNISEIVYFATDYNQVGKKRLLTDGVTGFPVYSIDQMVDYIIKL